MFKDLKYHKAYYTTLFCIALFGLFFIYFFKGNTDLQMVIVVLTAFFYCGWGILHHILEHDITAKIVLEYILIGALGITVVFFLL